MSGVGAVSEIGSEDDSLLLESTESDTGASSDEELGLAVTG